MADREFSGDPETRWLTEQGADRQMELLIDFWFRDSAGKQWDARNRTVVDGASIPRFLWALIGSPYTGDYRRASIVHDVACVEAYGDDQMRRAADRMFFEACREGGCSRWDAIVLYVGVRFGAWTSNGLIEEDTRPRLGEDSNSELLRREFRRASEEVLREGETDDPAEVERRTDAAMQKLEARLALSTALRSR